MNANLSPIRTAFLRLIMACYGPWYLLRLPSGNWHTSWHHDVDDEQAMESYLLDDGEVDGTACFPTRRAAMRAILHAIDSESDAGGDAYVDVRRKARDSLVLLTTDQGDSSDQNDFAGTADEENLINYWMACDRRAANAKHKAAQAEAAYEAARAEQQRRERVFKQLIQQQGDKVIEEINSVIENAWLISPPKSRRTAYGEKAGDTMPMPQLAVLSGKVVFTSPGRANPLAVKTPLSKDLTRRGFVHHWKHSTWVDLVVPEIAKLLDRLEREA